MIGFFYYSLKLDSVPFIHSVHFISIPLQARPLPTPANPSSTSPPASTSIAALSPPLALASTALCRFKTTVELVVNELHKWADCLREGADKLSSATEESNINRDTALKAWINRIIRPMTRALRRLEEGGSGYCEGAVGGF